LVTRLRQDGLYGEALTNWTAETDAGSALLLNFTNIDSRRTAETFGKRILKLL
jgi:GntR family transcriptional regulator/MocR family aminotransferase